MNRKQVIKLLKSGNFTIAYHDNASAYIYKGRYEYDDLPENEVYSPEDMLDGYIPEVVQLLAEALGGATETI